MNLSEKTGRVKTAANGPLPLVAEAKPWLDRQLDDGPWLFWRAGSGDRRDGLVAGPFFACANPTCPCTEVDVELHGVDDGLMRAELCDSKLRLFFVPDRPPARLRDAHACVAVDFETGACRKRSGDEELCAWFEAALDGEMLDGLWGRWLACRGGAPECRGRPAVETGVMVAHDEVFTCRRDTYLVDGVRYAARDFHCLEPGCVCGEAMVGFAQSWARDHEPVGLVRVRLSDGEPLGFEADGPEPTALLRRLFEAHAARHRDPARLRRRHAELLAAPPSPAPVAEPARRQDARVGRNDPCPCGSGKKYKRCCG